MTIITAKPGTTWTDLVHFLNDKLVYVLRPDYKRITAKPGTIEKIKESRFLNKIISVLQQNLEHFFSKKRIKTKKVDFLSEVLLTAGGTSIRTSWCDIFKKLEVL